MPVPPQAGISPAFLCVLRASALILSRCCCVVRAFNYRVGNSHRTPTRPTIGNPSCNTGVAAV
jgi:hypothetical protein